MANKIFNPNEWLNARTDVACNISSNPNLSTSIFNLSASERPDSVENVLSQTEANVLNQVEATIQQIESRHIDITSDYATWRNIGFAFAYEFGESGRDFFHRISRFYPEYSQSECNKQFDNCLKAKGHGITIKTFFQYAKDAGINISFPRASKDVARNVSKITHRTDAIHRVSSDSVPKTTNLPLATSNYANTPKIPQEVYTQLPVILKQSTDMFKDPIEKDVLLIGALSVISGCLPNVQGVYFDEPVSAHLYSFITAPAGSGKGKLKWAKYFGLKIHKNMVEQANKEKEVYESEMEHYNNLNKNQRHDVEKPKEPKRKMFFIPANSSASAFIQAMSDNNFKGIIFETEADTLASTLKQDWGNFSDVLRKAFHHESTNMFRRKDNEHIEVEDPHLAIALSGTPKQVHNMMPDVENGLFSRFLYYAFEDFSDFKNPFVSHCAVNYTDFFEQQGEKIFDLYKILLDQRKPYQFKFTNEQGVTFTEQFNNLYTRNRMLLGNDFNANSRRLGLITFRIAMILRTLRIIDDGDFSNPLICGETDFNTAIKIAFTLEKHAIAVFQNLPNNNLKGAKLNFFNNLPNQFNRQDYLEVANQLGIKEKTAEKYITQFKECKLLEHEHNKYTKVNSG